MIRLYIWVAGRFGWYQRFSTEEERQKTITFLKDAMKLAFEGIAACVQVGNVEFDNRALIGWEIIDQESVTEKLNRIQLEMMEKARAEMDQGDEWKDDK